MFAPQTSQSPTTPFQGITTNNTMPADAFLVLFSFAPMALVAGAVERQLAAVLRLAVVTELVSTARGLQTKKARVTVRDINGQLRVSSGLQSSDLGACRRQSS